MTYPWHPRTDWATRHPSFSNLVLPVKKIFLHHDVYRYQKHYDPANERGLEEAEISRGGYIAVAYHLHVLGDGTQVELRPSNKKGGATIYNNDISLAICLPGNYQASDKIELSQIDSVGAGIAAWIKHGRAPVNVELHPHSDVFPTACPSDAGRYWIAEGRLHEIVERHLGESVPGPGPAPAPTDWEGVRRYVIAVAKKEVAEGPILRLTKPLMKDPVAGHNEVTWWQHALAVTMSAAVEADGWYGNVTATQTKRWQDYWNITADGIVGPQSRRTMVYNLSNI